MIIPTLSFGGAQNIALGLAEEASRQGNQVQFIVFYGINNYEDRLEAINAQTIHLNYKHGFGAKDILNLLELRNRFFKTIKRLNPEIIHSHLFLTKLLFFGSKKLDIPILDTQHDMSPWWSRKGVGALLKFHIERYFAKNVASKVIAISEGVEKGVIEKLKIPSSKVSVILNFVEKKDNSDVNPISIYMVTRLDLHKKGLDLAVSIIDFLVKKRKVYNFKVFILGDGPDKKAMKHLIVEKGLELYFEFKGYQQDVYKFYAQADIVIMPSRWEGFGLAAAEAAMAEAPVIAFDIPGLNEVIVHNDTGILVKAYDIELFSDSIASLIQDDLLRKKLMLNSKKRANLLYNKVNAFNSYFEEYKKIINSKNSI
jgi:glycosyltransferase involved in cell wall biosynthesis